MRRIFIEVILLIAALAAGTYAAMSVAKLRGLGSELSIVKEENAKLESYKQKTQKIIEELQLKEKLFNAARYAIASGTMLLDLEAAIEKSSTQTAEQQLALGGLRLLVKGSDNPDTLKSFQIALELVDWSKHLKMVCAAQLGIAATGKEQQVLEECKKNQVKLQDESAAAKEGPQLSAAPKAKSPDKN